MYQYDKYDHQMLAERVIQFRDQTERYLAGNLSDSEFLPLRLQNGLYIQRLAPMLRVAIPYGLLSSSQLRKLAFISKHFDKGYGHFTTRQNIQFNWPELEDVPDILAHLAEVEMHAILTSGIAFATQQQTNMPEYRQMNWKIADHFVKRLDSGRLSILSLPFYLGNLRSLFVAPRLIKQQLKYMT